MSVVCTKDIRTHVWMAHQRMQLSTVDVEGFYSVFLVWRCLRCACRIWADGVIHQTTRPFSPVEWDAITQDTSNPWQQEVERLRRAEIQRETVRATIRHATRPHPRRPA